MTLPLALRRLPYVFYALSLAFFVWSIANQWFQLSAMGASYSAPGVDGLIALQKSQMLYSSSLEAAYMLANGAIVHVLISIYDKLKGAAE